MPGTPDVVIRSLLPPHWPAVYPLVGESGREGFAFLERLVSEFQDGSNRFDAPGEALLGAWRGPHLVAVGGLNRDPYVPDARVGRLRHLYVRRPERGQGLGRALVAALLADAARHFDVIRLRTDTVAAAQFYQALGFVPIKSPDATHQRVLAGAAREITPPVS
jgi:GNAT superfamily N-acetyltransferase